MPDEVQAYVLNTKVHGSLYIPFTGRVRVQRDWAAEFNHAISVFPAHVAVGPRNRNGTVDNTHPESFILLGEDGGVKDLETIAQRSRLKFKYERSVLAEGLDDGLEPSLYGFEPASK